MLVSTNLCVIPFLGHCDNARLQMSAKQLAQALTHPNCEVPKVMAHTYHLLSDSSKRFKYTTPLSGEVIYKNDNIMIINSKIDNNDHYIEVLDTPPVIGTSSLFASQLRFQRDVGSFNPGDVIFEYDCFNNNIPTYGYNIWTAYTSWFGLNHEDSIVLSQSALNKMRSTKQETILIPVYEYSMFRTLYPDSPYKFIPDIGQSIQDNIVTFRNAIRPGSNILKTLKNISLSELASIANDDKYFNSIPITSRLLNSTVLEIRVHRINKELSLIDKNLELYIQRIIQDYDPKLKNIADSLRQLFTKEFSNSILASKYLMVNKLKNDILDRNQIVYLIELKLANDTPSSLGDKFSNRLN